MGEKASFFVLRAKAVPEVLLRVVEAKRLLDSGKVESVQEATEMVQISRSSFYKYKDDIFPYHENAKGKTIIVSSHDLFLLEKYCNKVLFLENGTLLYYGDLKKFLKLNANKRLYLVKTDTVFKNDILFNDSRVTALYNPNDEKSFFIELTNGASLENALQDFISSYNIIELKLFDKNDLRSIFINEKGRDKNAS